MDHQDVAGVREVARAAKNYGDDMKFEPYWWEQAPRPELPSPVVPARIDVAIVGSGYTGLSAALTLARAGRSVVVFEASEVGHGGSTRNGGGFGMTLKTPFPTLAAKLGLKRATALFAGALEAVDYLGHLIESEGIDCQYDKVGRFIGAHRPKDYDALGRDLELQRQHLGIEGEMVPREAQHREVGTDHYHGGRLLHAGGVLQPALYHQGLLERVLQAGVRIAAHRPVNAIGQGKDGFTVVTGGGDVEARDVIVATNGYTGTFMPWLRRRIIPIQSQIIVTEPLAPGVMDRLIPKRRMLGDTCKLHHYYRPSPDGRRIVFGGRAGATEIGDAHASGAHLYRRLTALFPELADIRITHSWTGFTGYTFDTLPHMGVRDGVHYAAGFCGSGTAMAAYLGHKIALRVLGSPEAANIFDTLNHPTRPLYYGTPWFLPPILTYYGWRDGLRL